MSIFSGIISVRFLVLIHSPRCARRQESMVLKQLSMEGRLRRIWKYGSPRSTCTNSTLHANTGLSFSQMPASKLSYASIVLWVGLHLPSVTTPLMILSAVVWTKRWSHLSVSFGSFMRSMRSLCFCDMLVKSSEDWKYSTFSHKDCTKTFQLCGMILAPNTEPIGVQRVWPREHVRDTAACRSSFARRNAP